MAENCYSLGCPEVVRFSLMDACTGAPVDGAGNGYAVACPRNVTMEPITREGETSEFISDCGYVVAREQQDDQHIGWTVSFETASRSNELEALLTGKDLIASGGENIGTMTVGGQGCGISAPDPRVIMEAFYRLSQCTTGATHVRKIIPNIQFQVTEMDREGSLSYQRYTGRSTQSLAAALTTGTRTGPFNDLPADVVTFLDAQAADTYFVDIDFSETITISGACGAIAVPAAP